MATGTAGTQARQLPWQVTHYLRRRVTFADVSGTQYKIGTIPANALVLRTVVSIQTAFNAGTTNVLIVGTSGDDDALVAAAGVDETAVAVTSVAPATLGGLMSASADTDLYTKYTQTGTAATTGVATVVVEYVPDNDL